MNQIIDGMTNPTEACLTCGHEKYLHIDHTPTSKTACVQCKCYAFKGNPDAPTWEGYQLKWTEFSSEQPDDGKSVLTMNEDGYLSSYMIWNDLMFVNQDGFKMARWSYLPNTGWNPDSEDNDE